MNKLFHLFSTLDDEPTVDGFGCREHTGSFVGSGFHPRPGHRVASTRPLSTHLRASSNPQGKHAAVLAELVKYIVLVFPHHLDSSPARFFDGFISFQSPGLSERRGSPGPTDEYILILIRYVLISRAPSLRRIVNHIALAGCSR